MHRVPSEVVIGPITMRAACTARATNRVHSYLFDQFATVLGAGWNPSGVSAKAVKAVSLRGLLGAPRR